jgi:hypothetical protein
MNSQNIALVGILLACGAVAHLVASTFPTPIVSNFSISFYCLAIILTRPKFMEVLGIGVAAGIIFALIGPSINPLGNLISEPVGALICLFIYALLAESTGHAASVATFYATCVSGFTFVLVALTMAGPAIALEYGSPFSFFTAVFPILLVTAIVNSLVIGLLLRLVTRLITFSEFSEF